MHSTAHSPSSDTRAAVSSPSRASSPVVFNTDERSDSIDDNDNDCVDNDSSSSCWSDCDSKHSDSDMHSDSDVHTDESAIADMLLEQCDGAECTNSVERVQLALEVAARKESVSVMQTQVASASAQATKLCVFVDAFAHYRQQQHCKRLHERVSSPVCAATEAVSIGAAGTALPKCVCERESTQASQMNCAQIQELSPGYCG